jgi:hypothetical protein
VTRVFASFVTGRLETPPYLCNYACATLGPKTGEKEMTKTISLVGTTLELVERGRGRPLLFLHPGEGLAPERSWLELLSRRFRVIAPWHPGYGNSPLIDGSGSVDDLAYLYLDLAAELRLENAVLTGAASAAGSRPR